MVRLIFRILAQSMVLLVSLGVPGLWLSGDSTLVAATSQTMHDRQSSPAADQSRNPLARPVLISRFDNMSALTFSGASVTASFDHANQGNRPRDPSGLRIAQRVPSRSSLTVSLPIGAWKPADLGTVAIWVDRKTEGNIAAENLVIAQGPANYQVSFPNEQIGFLPGGRWLAANISEFASVATSTLTAPMLVKISFNQQPPYGATGSVDDLYVKAAGRPTLVPVFDDATIETYTNVYPLLSKLGLRATVAVPINYVGRSGRMSWSQLQSLYADGWDMACNTTSDQPVIDKTHFPTTQSVVDNFEQCRAALTAHGMGRAANHIDWSNGVTTDEIATALQRAGFLSMRGTEPQTFFTRFGIGAGAVKRMPSTGFRASSVAGACTAVVDQVVLRGTTGFYTIHDVSNTPSAIGFRLSQFAICAKAWKAQADAGRADILTWSQFWSRDGKATPPGR